jgi:hypothetical protein
MRSDEEKKKIQIPVLNLNYIILLIYFCISGFSSIDYMGGWNPNFI